MSSKEIHMKYENGIIRIEIADKVDEIIKENNKKYNLVMK